MSAIRKGAQPASNRPFREKKEGGRKPVSPGNKKMKMDPNAQVLPAGLIMGAVLMIFALAMVSMLSNSVKLNQKVNSGTTSTLTADGVVDKAVNVLTQGNNWGSSPSMAFTPIPGFRGDLVYTDMPNSQYVVQINPGNLTKSPGDQAQPLNLSSPPGDPAYERTITVDIYSMPKGYISPSSQPTPWTTGGTPPAGFASHRTIQAVVRRGSMTASLVANGTVNVGGHWRVYWGDIYDWYQPSGCSYPCTTVTVITLGTQPLGPGYPAVHTAMGCINSSGSCGGCFGGSGSTNSTVCETTDTGAANCKLYPNDPNMPPKPSVDLDSLKSTAQKIYVPGSGMPGAGLSSGESGYFYYSPSYSAGAGTNSLSGLSAGTGVEANHQYTGSDFGLFFGGNTQLSNVLARMAQNLGLSSSWGGNDDLVAFVDTTDGNPLASDLSNACNAGSAISLKQAGFVGTLIIQGSIDDAGGSNFGINTTMNPPDATWCPGTTTTKVCVDGFMYIGGTFHSTGSPTFYGAVDDEGSFSGNGTPTLYYRSNFKYNLIESGTVSTTRWQEIKQFPTPMP